MNKDIQFDIIANLSQIDSRFEAILCDVWGVLHDGVTAAPSASQALRRYKSAYGRPVILVTNAPRPASYVIDQLRDLGVPDGAYDRVVTSGDVCRALIAAWGNARAYHLGPPRDLGLFDGLSCQLSDIESAEFIVCTGLFDDRTELPKHYHERFLSWIDRGLKMICANPDQVIHRGGTIVHCAGALADLYQKLGGQVEIAGKPYLPIFHRAREYAEKITEKTLAADRILVIGDGLATDIRGAHNAGFSALFITGGIHLADFAADFGAEHGVNRKALASHLAGLELEIAAAMPALT